MNIYKTLVLHLPIECDNLIILCGLDTVHSNYASSLTVCNDYLLYAL